MNPSSILIVMLGATGAVGTETVQTLLTLPQVKRLTLLGRRVVPSISAEKVRQHKINIFAANSYQEFLSNHDTAICTLGVGQPSKVSKADFLKIDKTAVLDFATACKNAGIRHFELLASVGIDAGASSFYLRTKGELVDELKKLNFERLSIFQPSMIMTPVNRYGFSQAILLNLWPLLKPLLIGKLRKYRGIPVETLGEAMAVNVLDHKTGFEELQWDDFQLLTRSASTI